jgi:hypothetical protein
MRAAAEDDERLEDFGGQGINGPRSPARCTTLVL